jgi:hypothetical protein
MERVDHARTSSYGSSNLAQTYRSNIQSMLNQGRMRDVMAKEIRDVRNTSGTKYNSAIQEMLNYAKNRGILNK